MAEASLGPLDRRIRFESNVIAKTFMGAGKVDWQLHAECWASVEDMVPSRADRIDDTLEIVRRPTRIRARYRTDITAAMRVVIDPGLVTQRIVEIVAGPVGLGRRKGIELLVQDSTTQGQPA